MLYDSLQSATLQLPADSTIRQLVLRVRPEVPTPGPNLALLIYVGDLAAPRARVMLRDLLKQGGRRPLNLCSRAGDVLRIVLADPDGTWASGAPWLEVTLLV